jgi:predicted nucleic acid-binding protein
MPEIKLFLDSSALMAGILSADGAARVLLLLAEGGQIAVTISEQVLVETERAIARKVPKALNDLRQAILASQVRIVRDPSSEDISAHLNLVSHPADIPIVLAAMQAKVDYQVTLNQKHFIADPGVAQQSGLRIGTPGDALNWVRGQVTTEDQSLGFHRGFESHPLLQLFYQ